MGADRPGRDIYLIACFEHLQSSNWTGGSPTIAASDMCDLILPVRARLTPSTDVAELLSAEFIGGLANDLGARLPGCIPPVFRDPAGWRSFLDELTVEFSVEEFPFTEIGSYLMSQLSWMHLTAFRLLIAWLIVDALGRARGVAPLTVSEKGLGWLIAQLSTGGPPVWDVEDMRGRFPDHCR